MKIPIILCCFFALGTCGTWKWKRENLGGDFEDMVKGYGYQVESYDVQTEDGYILKLFRIPRGREGDSGQASAGDNLSGGKKSGKRAVFLMHGLMTNCESFIYGGPSQSLALKLADAGYDVYFGNSRGTVYGQSHTTLNPQTDAAFWRFCWQEIGTKDLPALIDKALSISGRPSMTYIGHNEGNTAFYVMASEKSSYNSKIDRQISLGPVAYLMNAESEIIDNIKDHVNSKAWILKNLGVNAFSPTNELISSAASNCNSNKNDERICKNVYFLLNGYNSNNLNETTINQVIPRVPSTVSVRAVVHLAQLRKNGRFQKYSEDAESTDADNYNLSNMKVPVFLFYTPSDPLSNVQDVAYLATMLPNVQQQHNFEELKNNVDLLWSKNAQTVFNKVKQAMETDTSDTKNN